MRLIILPLVTAVVIVVGAFSFGDETETLPPLKDGKAPQTFAELWSGLDPRKEPLDVEVLHEWEQDGVVLKVIRYRVGIFKGKKAMMAAVYGYPKGASKVRRRGDPARPGPRSHADFTSDEYFQSGKVLTHRAITMTTNAKVPCAAVARGSM